jgi:hypothetical protein
MAPPEEQKGVKVVVIDIPTPSIDLPDIRPGDPLPMHLLPGHPGYKNGSSNNGHRPEE